MDPNNRDVSVDLVELLTDENFELLLSSFHSAAVAAAPPEWPTDSAAESHSSRLRFDAFQKLLRKLLRVPVEDQRLFVLCKKIDIEGDGYITENKLMAYLLQQFKEREAVRSTTALPFQEPPIFKQNMYSKQSSCRLMSITSPSRFISVTKDGVIATWSSYLELQKGTVMDDKATMIDRDQLNRLKRNNLWVTDATVISSFNILVISTTSRELNFYDVSSNVYKCLYRLCDVPSVPLCLMSHTNTAHSTAIVLYGDAAGNVTVLHFLVPSLSLFTPCTREASSMDNVQLILYPRLASHDQYVTATFLPKVHSDWIQRIMYLPHNHSTITCSNSYHNSLVIRDIDGKRKPYIFNLIKGVLCFDYDCKANLLVTGSPDHVVRFWDPYVPAAPVAVVKNHSSPILDVLIHKEMKLVHTFSRDLTLCVWDMHEYNLLQVLNVKFPFSQRQPDFSATILTLLSPTQLTIMCNEYTAVYKLGNINNGSFRMSHSSPVRAVVYESQFEQIISGGENGEISTWDISTGSKVRSIKGCHGDIEMTHMSIDANGHQLITGSRTGEIKVWNHFNGECLKTMESSGLTEVTGVIHVMEKSLYLAVGWNKVITAFNDISDTSRLESDHTIWTNRPHHKDDILTVSYCAPNYLATGSFDGETKVWNIETTVPIAQFKSLTQIRAAINLKLQRKRSSFTNSKSEMTSFSPSRPASRLSHRIKSNSNYFLNAPVDKVIFLKTRIPYRQTQGVLVTSEAGIGRFWSFPGSTEPQGSLALTMKEDENVMALASDPDDQYLVAGNTAGYVSVFDISNYCKGNETPGLLPLVTWQAHAGEITSVEYILHSSSQSLIVTSSIDCTVRLWTNMGHYIGTFGQKRQWNLMDNSTFQHPLTPWGDSNEAPQEDVHTTDDTDATNSSSSVIDSATAAVGPSQLEGTVTQKGGNTAKTSELPESGFSSLTSSVTSMQTSAFDNKLADQYQDRADQRIADKQERRLYYSGVSVQSTEKFGMLCSPFQALQLLDVTEPTVPKTVTEFLYGNK